MQPETIINHILQERQMWLTLDDIATRKDLLLAAPPQTIAAVKFIRQETAMSLKEVKEAVEAINTALAK
jgi:ribosomal protein L7/L12